MLPVRPLLASCLTGALLLTIGCAAENGTKKPTDSDVQSLGHVHGLGVDPGDGTLYAATHFGVIRIDEDGALTRIADRWQDTMAFTVIGPEHFLGSGHPDLREDSPPHLGLIESTDAARTWSSVSLRGQADFHALDVAGESIYAFDSLTNRVMTTIDGKAWSVLARETVVDLVAHPADDQELLMASPNGDLRIRGLGSTGVRELKNAPPLQYLAWPTSAELAGVTADGHVYLSENEGESWTRLGDVPGVTEAFDVTGERWYVATDRGIYQSPDQGRTWTALVRVGP